MSRAPNKFHSVFLVCELRKGQKSRHEVRNRDRNALLRFIVKRGPSRLVEPRQFAMFIPKKISKTNLGSASAPRAGNKCAPAQLFGSNSGISHTVPARRIPNQVEQLQRFIGLFFFSGHEHRLGRHQALARLLNSAWSLEHSRLLASIIRESAGGSGGVEDCLPLASELRCHDAADSKGN